MVEWMKVLILMGALLLIGCGGGLDNKGIHYLKQSQPFQQNLTIYQQKLKDIGGLPPDKRFAASNELLAQVQAEHKKLAQLETTPKVMPVHQELDALYTTMEAYVKSSGVPSDPRVAKLAKEWADHLDKMNQELQHLAP